jgi:hypothetical protein
VLHDGISVTLFRLTILCAIFLAGFASADNESRLRKGGSPASIRLAGTEDANNVSKVYIVQLRTPAAAEFHATSAAATRAVAKTSPGQLASVTPFDKHNPAVQNHVEKLVREQASVITRAGPGVEQIHTYQYALNGFAAMMSPQQATKVEHMPEVLRIWEDEVRPLTTNFSADFLDLFAADGGLRGAPGLDGDGIVIGVIDSGMRPIDRNCAAAPGRRFRCLADGFAIVSTRWTMSRNSMLLPITGTAYVRPARSLLKRIATTN